MAGTKEDERPILVIRLFGDGSVHVHCGRCEGLLARQDGIARNTWFYLSWLVEAAKDHVDRCLMR